MNNLILYLIFFIIGIFSINFIKSMCNCNIIEGQSCNLSDTCNTINGKCSTIINLHREFYSTFDDLPPNIKNNVDIENLIPGEITDQYNNISTFCRSASITCNKIDEVISVLNNGKTTIENLGASGGELMAAAGKGADVAVSAVKGIASNIPDIPDISDNIPDIPGLW